MAPRKAGGKKRGGAGKKKGYKGLPPRQPQRISLYNAVELTQRYRKAAPASEHGGFFWGDGIRELLDQPGCVGLRYYHGLNASGNYQVVLVGVDANGEDIVKAPRPPKGAAASVQSAFGGDAVLLDQHWPCPPFCPPNSPLL